MKKKRLFTGLASILLCAFLLFNTLVINVNAVVNNFGWVDMGYTPNLPEDTHSESAPDMFFYDPRTTNSVTHVKNQYSLGTCWAFASTALMESATFKATGVKNSYSEESMRFILSNKLAHKNNDFLSLGYYDRDANSGGNVNIAMAYYTSPNSPIFGDGAVQWITPNLEEDVPYTREQSYANLDSDYWPQNIDNSFGNVYASKTEYVNKEDVKEYVWKYGGVYAGVFVDIQYNCFNASHQSFYNGDVSTPNHAIEIIGWDDNFPKEYFNNNGNILSNGAWLAKNSNMWGVGAKGYMWVSYETKTLTDNVNIFCSITDVDKKSKNEQMLSYDFIPLQDTTLQYNNVQSTYIANVYDISELRDNYNRISKVMIYSGDIGSTYRVYVAPVNSDGTIPNLSSLGSPVGYGTVDAEGYITSDFVNPYIIPDNATKIAVIVRFIPNADKVTLYREKLQQNGFYPRINPGESYVNINNEWVDISGGETTNSYGNFCIRPTLVRTNNCAANSTLSLDKVAKTNDDITVQVEYSGNALYSIEKNGAVIMLEDSDYTRTGETVTIKKKFLNTLSDTDVTNIWFNFTDGQPQLLQIVPNPELTDGNVTGKIAVGQTLTATVQSDSGAVPAGKLSYQWQNSADGSTWTDIQGAVGSTYTLTNNDFNKYVRVQASTNDNTEYKYPSQVNSSPTATKVIIYGDVDLNGAVENADTTTIQYYLAHMISLTAEQLVAADVDGDGAISMNDVTYLQQYLANYISKFPVEQ